MSRYLAPETGLLTTRNLILGLAGFCGVWLLAAAASPAQAALAGFLVGAAVWLHVISRHQLEGIEVRRSHRERVFEDDSVLVSLRLTRGEGLPVQMIELEDRFMASLSVSQKHLVPVLGSDWEMLLHYERQAERHRGLYLLGPVVLQAADPLGAFVHQRELDCFSRLTVYPHADPLPDYRVPGPQAPSGPSMDEVARVGQGEEILGIREYRPGDPPARVHWRTSARRGALHVLQLNRPIQAELAVMLDLTRRSRFGLGAESTTELAIRAATSILTRGYAARHRLSLLYAHEQWMRYPPGSGLAHLHLLLDRLAVIQPAGETDFWEGSRPSALDLRPGSRAVFVLPARLTPPAPTASLVTRLTAAGVGVDLVLIDETDFIKIYRDQEVDVRGEFMKFEILADQLKLAGARVFPLGRKQTSLSVGPHAVDRRALPVSG